MKLPAFGRLCGTLLLLLAFTWNLTSCSSDDDDDAATGRYAIQLNGRSLNYTSNTPLQAVVDSIIYKYCPQNPGYFEGNSETANRNYYNAYNEILNYDWEHSGIDIADSTYLDLALIAINSSNQGNIVLNRRRITFPHFVYRLFVSNKSANYELNVRATFCVDSILTSYSSSENQTFSGTRQLAYERYEAALEAINTYNWRRNDLSILRGTSFTLSLVYGADAPDLDDTVLRGEDIDLYALTNE